jgi:hypothetical protein
MIILGIAMMIAVYDYNYNYDDYVVYHSQRLESKIEEIRSSGDINQELNAYNKLHEGHDHWIMPFDFQNVQKSIWIAIVPVTAILWLNLKILQMDNMSEFVYFKKTNGLVPVQILKMLSIGLFVLYGIVIVVNFNRLEHNKNW